MGPLPKLRVLAAAAAAVGAAACSGPGINAGEEGGRAFIAFAIMLIVMVGVLAIFLGKED
jgi:hypothetical protein